MTEAEKMDLTTSVFVALVSEKQDRLTKGLMLRQAMHDTIKRGEKPTGYRPEWLKARALELVKVMAAEAQKFDEAHPDDKCSVSDILDVLVTTAGLFKSAHD